jgi:iron(III) transport system permease protein
MAPITLETASHKLRRWSWPSWSLAHPLTFLLYGVTAVVIFLMLLTPAYLILRTAEAGPKALELLTESRNLAIWGRTLLLTASVTLTTAVIAVPLAWLTTSTDLPGKRFWSITAALPLVIPSYVYAYLFIATFGPRGTLQQTLEPLFGITRLPDIYGFWGAWLVLSLISYPYTYLTVRAGIRHLDACQIEAARSLGLTAQAAFWRIVLPQLRPAIIAGSLLVSLYTLRDFGAVQLLRYGTFTRAIYVQYQSFFDRSLAATLALQLVLLTAVILYFEWRSRGRASYRRTSVGVARRLPIQPLGWWRWPAFAFTSTIVGLALFLPAGSLLYWLGRGLMQDWLAPSTGRANLLYGWPLWEAAWHSVAVAGVAAVVTAVLAFPVALLAVRHKNRFTQFAEQLTYTGFALPGLVIALAMVYFGANYLPNLYQTLPLLILAYVILFIPQAIGSTRASFLQIPANLEAAGRSLGHSPLTVLRRITLPLVRPGVLSGLALVFLTTMKELPATLLLSPYGFKTLPIEVWSNISEAFFAQAALPTLLLILLSSVPLAWLNRSEK